MDKKKPSSCLCIDFFEGSIILYMPSSYMGSSKQCNPESIIIEDQAFLRSYDLSLPDPNPLPPHRE
jgi:hypothetical protein